MITAKFGGTAITPQNLHCLKSILTPRHNVVVVSAIGKCHPNDIKTTDLLATYYNTHDQQIWQTICQRYRNLVQSNQIDMDIDRLLFDAHSRALKFNLDYCMSLGEELSAKVVANYLGATYIEAQDVICFDKHGLMLNKTISRLKVATRGAKLAVIGGFYGGCANTRKTFSRGGSDVTASICALATDATACQNWTDVNGVYQANPNEVSGAKTLTHLSYNQMYKLASSGAGVLHSDAIKPLQKQGIPLIIGNYLSPNGPKTVVSNKANTQSLLCVTQRKDKCNFVATVVHNMPKAEVYNKLNNLLDMLKTHHVPRKNAIFGQQLPTKPSVFCAQFPTNTPILSVCNKPHCLTIVSNANIVQQIFDIFNNNLQQK